MRNLVHSDSASSGNAADRRLGGRHVGICTVIRIQHGCLGTLKDDTLALLKHLVQQISSIRNIRLQLLSVTEIFFNGLFGVDLLYTAVYSRDHAVFERHIGPHLLREHLGLQQIAYTDANSLQLVHITGTNPPARSCRISIVLIFSRFVHQSIQNDMIRHYQMRTDTDLNLIHRKPLRFQLIQLL